MAEFAILASNAPYYTVSVSFGDQEFKQDVVSTLTGNKLNDHLQEYADDYERDWVAPVEEGAPSDPVE